MTGEAWWGSAAAVAMVLVGCSGDGGRGPAAEVVDSVGVRIVTYDLADVEVATYASVSERDLEIGILDGAAEYAFSRIIDVRTSDDGSIVVADEGSGALRVYDANGVYSRTLGQRGEGPGEFATAPLIAGLAGDTVFAWDSRSRRVTSFSGGGDVFETTTLQTLQREFVGPMRVVRQADGTYLAQSRWISPGVVGPHDMRVELDSVVIEHINAFGALIDTVRILADQEWAKIRQGRAGAVGLQMTPRPFTARAFMLSDGVRPIIGHSGSFELVLYGRGAEQTILRVEHAWPTMTAEDIQSRLDARLVEASEDGEPDPRILRLYKEFAPERVPDVSNIIISGNRDIWVASYEFDDSTGFEWLVFSSAGELHGRVRTPPGLRVFDIGSEWILGVVRDEFDVPYVRRYPLARSREGTRE